MGRDVRDSYSTQLREWLGLKLDPVAVAFRQTPPPEVPRIDTAEPAGCGYWREAAETGRAFYTVEADHYHCPIGSYTHGITLPPQQAEASGVLVRDMVDMGYIRQEELPSIPHRAEGFGVVVYGPLGRMPCEPDVVLIRGNVRQLMLLSEAAQAAGIAGSAAMGRPTCAMIPEVMQSGKAVASFACIGNRVYAGLGDDEAYYAIPGREMTAFLEHLCTVVQANRTLESYHRLRIGHSHETA